jgi:hypothetical protein
VEDETLSVHGMFARATDALAPPTPPAGPQQDEAQALVADLLAGMGWSDVRPEAVDRANLTGVLEKLLSTDLFHVDARVLRFYADHADAIARAEIAGLDENAGRAGLLEQMVVGTVVFGEVLTILRRLAEEHHSRERFGDVHCAVCQRRRSRALQHALCQCRRSSRPDSENIDGTTGQATVCGVAGRIVWSHPGQR